MPKLKFVPQKPKPEEKTPPEGWVATHYMDPFGGGPKLYFHPPTEPGPLADPAAPRPLLAVDEWERKQAEQAFRWSRIQAKARAEEEAQRERERKEQRAFEQMMTALGAIPNSKPAKKPKLGVIKLRKEDESIRRLREVQAFKEDWERKARERAFHREFDQVVAEVRAR